MAGLTAQPHLHRSVTVRLSNVRRNTEGNAGFYRVEAGYVVLTNAQGKPRTNRKGVVIKALIPRRFSGRVVVLCGHACAVEARKLGIGVSVVQRVVAGG